MTILHTEYCQECVNDIKRWHYICIKFLFSMSINVVEIGVMTSCKYMSVRVNILRAQIF